MVQSGAKITQQTNPIILKNGSMVHHHFSSPKTKNRTWYNRMVTKNLKNYSAVTPSNFHLKPFQKIHTASEPIFPCTLELASHQEMKIHPYCWWFRNPAIIIPLFTRFCTSQVVFLAGFLNHQEYHCWLWNLLKSKFQVFNIFHLNIWGPKNPDPWKIAILVDPHPCYTGSVTPPVEGPCWFLGGGGVFPFLTMQLWQILDSKV